MRPLIGVTASGEEKGCGRAGIYLGADYADALYAVGAWPVALPFTDDGEALADMAQRLDGLLLTGGIDVDPALFGEEPRLGLGEVSPIRDRMEIGLLSRVLARGRPVFGICRGIQVMNAALGGTLYQDLPREWGGALQHAQKAPRDHTAHAVAVAAGSRLREIAGMERLPVNTFHHQAIRALAPGFVATAHSPDGLVEAVELPGAPFCLGVQWHPENLWRTQAPHRLLFAAFVEAAAAAR